MIQPLAWLNKKYRQFFIRYPVTRKPSHIPGLKYIPSLEPHYSDDEDFILGLRKNVEREVTDRDLQKLREIFFSRKETCQCIVEIGVCRNEEHSLTHVFLNHKRDQTLFLGIDIDDKSFLNDPKRNIYTLQTDSSRQEIVRGRIRELGARKIDILLIDGWHSVNAVVNDWKYTDLLADDGIVILHDTNCHPGPLCVFDAVDEHLYQKQKFFRKEADWGMALVQKRI